MLFRSKIKGECLTLGVGEVGETFNGIGRGPLNIDGLPVYRDEFGGIGSPTSDEERTKISPETSNILIVINGYDGRDGLPYAGQLMKHLLESYASMENYKETFF